jgi:foldase protein PrsA
MTSRIPTALVCAVAVGGGTIAFSGCGDDVPANSVARVGDTTITKAEFNKWLHTAAKGEASQGGSSVAPDPPQYTACIAERQKQPTPKGASKPSAAALKQQCKQQYDRLKGEVMQFLIQAQWVKQEADKRNVSVSDAAVRRSFEDQKKQAFPNDKAYNKFLASSGMSEQDILFRVKLNELQTKLTQKVTEEESKVSDGDLHSAYDKQKDKPPISQPETRDLKVVLTKTKAKADQARKALQGKRDFKKVAKKYSIDEASKANGGELTGVAKRQQERALDAAVFKAKRGQLVGPVKTQFGWYVFEVTKVTPPRTQTFGQAKETLRNQLRGQRQQKALNDFVKKFREKYKDKTNCASGYVIAECKNAPKSKTQTVPGGGPQQGAPPGAAPQGAQPGGVTPQQGAPPSSGTPTPATPSNPTPQGPGG